MSNGVRLARKVKRLGLSELVFLGQLDSLIDGFACTLRIAARHGVKLRDQGNAPCPISDRS